LIEFLFFNLLAWWFNQVKWFFLRRERTEYRGRWVMSFFPLLFASKLAATSFLTWFGLFTILSLGFFYLLRSFFLKLIIFLYLIISWNRNENIFSSILLCYKK
jgi:hypothetical protein